MAGHSQFKNIMHRKNAQDKKRGKIFTKLIREITTAARDGGPDADANPRLRAAISAAKIANMPKDVIERAIKRGSGDADGENYEAVRYEGYGPNGIAIIVEALTDNRNRTAPEIRAAFSKYGGNLGETGSVGFLFEQKGCIVYPASSASNEDMFEAALEAGAQNVESNDEAHEVTCAPDDFGAVREALEKKFGDPEMARLVWEPMTETAVDDKAAETIFKLIDVLEDNDDVQYVYSNFAPTDQQSEKMAG